MQTNYEKMQKTIKNTTSETLGYKRKDNSKKWFNDRYKLART